VYGPVQSINNLFADNTGTNGAAIYLAGNSGTQTVRHTTIVSQTQSGGSAIHVNNGTATIQNTIITNHTAGIRQQGGTASEDYNLFYGNTYDTYGTVSSGGHSLSGQDPQFVNASGGNYHIDTESAALDAGAFGLGVADDFDGEDRPANSALPDAPDIGYDESKSLTVRRMLADTMTFGAACARIVFTDTGSLSDSDSVTITVEPGVFPSGVDPSEPVVSRTINISVSNSAAVSATLSVCYLDSEATGMNEPSLQLFRWSSGEWEGYSSTVDTTNNLVTGSKVIAFSPWLIGEEDAFPTAVDVFAFNAAAWHTGIRLRWETAFELNNMGFNLYRASTPDIPPLPLNETIIPSQNPGGGFGASYEYVDESAEPGMTYYYWLESVDIHSERVLHGPVAVTASSHQIYLPLSNK
jgi:hypothetical protein